MTRIRWYGPALVVAVTVLVVLLTGPRLVRNIVFAQQEARIELVSDSLEQSQLLAELSRAFRNVADVVRPSVVSIQVYAKPSRGRQLSPHLREWFNFRPGLRERFFGPEGGAEEFDGDGEDDYEQYNRMRPAGIGSGWVYDDQGHIITNNHVVTLGDHKTVAEKIEVHFADGDVRIAKVVNTDPDIDVAVLKVDGDGLHPSRVATEPVEQGDMVFAFGSPLQFSFSMSQGVISAKERQLGILRSRQGYENFLQTDAAINQGNSGGPLTNILGQVVGMNTAIATRDQLGRGFVGLGFAIPIDMVVNSVDQIITKGRVERGYLGITFQELEPRMAKTYGFDGTAVAVEALAEDGPAESAGIRTDDLITKVNGTPLKSGDHLRGMIAAIAPGETVKLEVFREDGTMQIDVELAAKPDDVTKIALRGSKRKGGEADEGDTPDLLRRIGLERATTFTKEMAERFDIEFRPGVIVLKVRRGSIAEAEGLRGGDRIQQVMNHRVETMEELIEWVGEHEDAELMRIRVVGRDGVSRSVFLDVPAED